MADNTTGLITAQNIRDFLVSCDPENAKTNTTFATKAAARKSGHTQYYSDVPIMGRDNGSSLDYFGPLLPATSIFNYVWTQVNLGNALYYTAQGAITIVLPGVAGDNLRIWDRPTRATPWTVTCYFSPTLVNSNYSQAGICLRESSSNKVVGFIFDHAGNVTVYKFTNLTTFSANYLSVAQYSAYSNPKIFRITDNGTNRIFQISVDGFNFITIYSVSRTDFCTPDRVGILVNNNNAGFWASCTFLSWLES